MKSLYDRKNFICILQIENCLVFPERCQTINKKQKKKVIKRYTIRLLGVFEIDFIVFEFANDYTFHCISFNRKLYLYKYQQIICRINYN